MSFAAASFLGSFLLFFLQPYLGKVLTPAFGGGAQVWLVCLVYFQCVLLLGYGYSHLLGGLSRRMQAVVHGILGVLAVGSLLGHFWLRGHPFDPKGILALGAQTSSYLSILGSLARTTLFPLLLLSANAPLTQEWYRLTRTEKTPYKLYAYSNAGSLLGLLAYPFLAEPNLSTPTQGVGVAWGIVAYLGLVGLNLFHLLKHARTEPQDSTSPAFEPEEMKPRMWVLGSAVGVMVLMAGTQVITHKVGAVPLLWVLPLALFLLTFILIFDGASLWSNPKWAPVWGTLAVAGFIRMFLAQDVKAFWWTVLGCSAWVFFGCLMVHGLLYRSRPHASKLTSYYLCMSLGGVLGGMSMGVIAPLIFDRAFEISLVPALVGTFFLGGLLSEGLSDKRQILVPAVFLLLGGWAFRAEISKSGYFGRDFYATLRAYQDGPYAALLNGSTTHGMMDVNDPHRPIGYFGPSSGVGRAIQVIQSERASIRMGIVGLGVGSLAAYLRPGDQGVFFEISQVVDEFAGVRGKYFPYLKGAKGNVEVRIGDGRRLLESELKNGKSGTYDILVIDAFSGDSVPWHLLTCEALQMYQEHLRHDGVLVIHLSNPLPLPNLVLNNARALGLYGALLMDVPPLFGSPNFTGCVTSKYMLLARNSQYINNPRILESAAWGFGPKIFARAKPGELPFLRDGKPWMDSRNSLSDLLFIRQDSAGVSRSSGDMWGR